MAEIKVKLKGLRSTYNRMEAGDVYYRKYKKEWHIYVSRTDSKPIITQAPNSIEYVEANPDLKEALQRAGKPLSTINETIDNARLGFSDIIIIYNNSSGAIVGHKLTVKSPDQIRYHKDAMKERLEYFTRLPFFGTFNAIANCKLTYKLSDDK